MAGIITLDQNKRWETSNWVYWALMDRALALISHIPHAARYVEECKWMQGLDIPLTRAEEPNIADEVIAALTTAAEECSLGLVESKVDGRVLDEVSQQQFRESVRKLASMLGQENRGVERGQ